MAMHIPPALRVICKGIPTAGNASLDRDIVLVVPSVVEEIVVVVPLILLPVHVGGQQDVTVHVRLAFAEHGYELVSDMH